MTETTPAVVTSMEGTPVSVGRRASKKKLPIASARPIARIVSTMAGRGSPPAVAAGADTAARIRSPPASGREATATPS